ncbi:MAG: YceI family protein [Saprospiraceae bacterium]
MKNIFKISFLLLSLSFIVACKSKGDSAKVSDTAGKVTKAEGKNFKVNTNVSKVIWVGTKATGSSHNGTINLSEGSLSMKDGNITGGSFVLDMNSITALDLEGDDKAYLESHLKGMSDKSADDFFNVRKFPKAKFNITKVSNLTGNNDATHLIYGNLTMKNTTKQVGFKAKVSVAGNAVNVSTPSFKINRTDWGIKYNSPTFFQGLKDKAINNDIELKINIAAKA